MPGRASSSFMTRLRLGVGSTNKKVRRADERAVNSPIARPYIKTGHYVRMAASRLVVEDEYFRMRIGRIDGDQPHVRR
jgi:hypothetical protein